MLHPIRHTSYQIALGSCELVSRYVDPTIDCEFIAALEVSKLSWQSQRLEEITNLANSRPSRPHFAVRNADRQPRLLIAISKSPTPPSVSSTPLTNDQQRQLTAAGLTGDGPFSSEFATHPELQEVLVSAEAFDQTYRLVLVGF